MFKMININVFFLFVLSLTLYTQETAESLLDKVDKVQRNYKTFSFNAMMEINNRGRKLVKTFNGQIQTEGSKAFMEYTNPQDRGSRYLKLDQDMWIYMPAAQDVLKISGHLLRDGVMGSDMSYNDILDLGSYNIKYEATLISDSTYEGKEVYILTVTAKDDTASYAKIDMTVDKKKYLIYKMIMYAKGRDGDRAIKEFTMDDYKNFSGINVAMYMTVKDLRKKDSQTVMTYQEVKVNPDIKSEVFTRSYLEH